jgi:hypothetical protein
MDSTTIIAYCGLITSVGSAAVALINRRRIRSHCCGKELAADITIDKMPPTPQPATPRPEPPVASQSLRNDN